MSILEPKMDVFVDESKTMGYFIAAAAVAPENVTTIDKGLRKLTRRGQSRMHFKSEGDSSRRQLLARMAEMDVRERDASIMAADRRIIRASLVDNDYVDQLQYQHVAPADHSVLWVSDAVAWCHQAGGEWIKRAEPIVGEITKLG